MELIGLEANVGLRAIFLHLVVVFGVKWIGEKRELLDALEINATRIRA